MAIQEFGVRGGTSFGETAGMAKKKAVASRKEEGLGKRLAAVCWPSRARLDRSEHRWFLFVERSVVSSKMFHAMGQE